MSRRSSGRSLVGLILEIGFIALVVTLVPKLNLRPQSPADVPNAALSPRAFSAPESESPWWQAEPSAHATSWRTNESQPVNVEQTLQNASRSLIGSASEYAGRTAHDLFVQPNSEMPNQSEPHDWRRY